MGIMEEMKTKRLKMYHRILHRLYNQVWYVNSICLVLRILILDSNSAIRALPRAASADTKAKTVSVLVLDDE